jgi:uncharacterized protein YkwD
LTTHKPKPRPDYEFFDDAVALLELHNSARTSPLTLEIDLVLFAQNWADRMASRRAMWHSSMKFRGQYKAENVAAGQATVESVFDTWMRSRGHRRNLMNPVYNKAGFGVATGSNGKRYWCAVFAYRD